MEIAQRLKQIPPYIFVELDRLKKEALQRGEDVISLSIGDPDLPTPQLIVEALAAAAKKPENHCYPLGTGKLALREEIARYYQAKFGVALDPVTEILVLIGSKEGIGHLPLALVDPGTVVLYPEPGYPVYRMSALFAGGEPVALPLTRENSFLPDLDSVPPDTLRRTRLLWLNYPNNPTGAFASVEFFEKVVWFARRYNFVIAHDAAYIDLVFGSERAHSILEISGAKDVAIEFHSFSKTFHMTGWRIGFAVGNRDVVKALAEIKANLDSGVFGGVQDAAIVALQHFDELVPKLRQTYEERCRVLMRRLEQLKWPNVTPPRGTFYVWLPTLHGKSSMEMTMELLKKCAVMVTPGTAFGDGGEGYIRIALTAPEERIEQAFDRIERAGIV